MRTEKNLAKIVQCMKWAAALAVARSLEVRDLLERGEKISLEAVPGPRADGRVGPWPDHLLEAGVEVLASLLEALYRELTGVESRPIHERIQLALQPVLPDHSCVLVLAALEGTLRFAVAIGPEADAESVATIAAVQRLLHSHLGEPAGVN